MTPYDRLTPLAKKALFGIFSLGRISAGNASLTRELLDSGWCEMDGEKLVLSAPGKKAVASTRDADLFRMMQ